jgi:hypothetical protein
VIGDGGDPRPFVNITDVGHLCGVAFFVWYLLKRFPQDLERAAEKAARAGAQEQVKAFGEMLDKRLAWIEVTLRSVLGKVDAIGGRIGIHIGVGVPGMPAEPEAQSREASLSPPPAPRERATRAEQRRR